jgi:TolB-like protein
VEPNPAIVDSQSRRLAAILAADIAGYSALMGADEARTVRDLKGNQAVVLPMVSEFGGRVIDTAGDGILAEFASVVNAVKCAVAIQSTMAKRNAAIEPEHRMQFRIGINVGDIVYDDARIYGDGINVAARLESIAEPGGICISSKVYEEINGRIDLAYQDIGEQQLKNITRPVRVYRVRLNSLAPAAAPVLALPDKPSIAVLPFQNMSGDPEQEYFADGMVEEIITALSRIRWLFVIARNSSFTYKGRAVDVKQVGRELGVRYVLEGSVRNAANRVRVTGQLIDAANGTHLWADRFDGAIDDVFDLQDRVTASVVGAIAPKLQQAEIERAKRKPTDSLDAYDHFLRGMACVHLGTRQDIDEALRLFYRAIELDRDFASAYGMAAWCFVWRKVNGWIGNRAQRLSSNLPWGAGGGDPAADPYAAPKPSRSTQFPRPGWHRVRPFPCRPLRRGVDLGRNGIAATADFSSRNTGIGSCAGACRSNYRSTPHNGASAPARSGDACRQCQGLGPTSPTGRPRALGGWSRKSRTARVIGWEGLLARSSPTLAGCNVRSW